MYSRARGVKSIYGILKLLGFPQCVPLGKTLHPQRVQVKFRLKIDQQYLNMGPSEVTPHNMPLLARSL